jgi:host factor-I protein
LQALALRVSKTTLGGLAGRNTIKAMNPPATHLRRSKTPPPGDTGQEALYLRSLSERQISVAVQLRDGETIQGWIEYFDDGMIRITRDGHPNLFIYKHQIRSITEVRRRIGRNAENEA